MNTALAITLLGLTAAVSWGIGDFFAAKAAKAIGGVLSAVLINVVSTVVFVLIYLIAFRDGNGWNWPAVLYAAISGVFLSIGGMLFSVALEAGPVSIVSPIASTYPLIVTILALAIFHANLTLSQILGIVFVVGGVMFASGMITAVRHKRKLTKGPFVGIFAALFWGIGFTLLAQATNRMGWQHVTLIEFISTVATLITMAYLLRGSEAITRHKITKGFRSKYILWTAVIQLFGFMALTFGLVHSSANGGAVIIAISACYPILTILLALKHFEEKVELIPLAGALLGIAGIVVLSL